jgi:hypothetical protein
MADRFGAGEGVDCSGLRVARWVADWRVRSLFCVARRCSVLAFPLVRPYSRWSGNAFGLHGMQEVWGSNPHSSTGQRDNSNGSHSEYSRKVPQRGNRLRCPHACPRGHFSRLVLLGRARDSRSRTEISRPLSWANALPSGSLALAAESRTAELARKIQQ